MLNRYTILTNKSDESNFWPTFTDLLSGILLLIVIMMMLFVAIKSNELEQAQMEVESQRGNIEAFENQIEGFRGFTNSINQQIEEEFKDSGLPINLNTVNGSLMFEGDILFDVDKSELRPEFIQILDEFIPQYLGILLSDKNQDRIAEIIIEGHTDDVESYIYNLDLSQARAYSVARYILSMDSEGYYNQEMLKKVITANGKSFSGTIDNSDGTVNRDASRRVEFKYRLKEAEFFEETVDEYNQTDGS